MFSWGAFKLLTRAPGQAQVSFDGVLVSTGGFKWTTQCLPMTEPHVARCFAVVIAVERAQLRQKTGESVSASVNSRRYNRQTPKKQALWYEPKTTERYRRKLIGLPRSK